MFLVCHNWWATEILGIARSKEIGRYDANLSVRLFKHTLPDGRVFTEFVQGQQSVRSGVLFFVAFKDEQGNPVKESLWKESTMVMKD